MCEMLANQYFLVQRFKDAANQYERTLIFEPNNNIIKKKLVICYLKLKEIVPALTLFTEIISNNIEILLDQETKIHDCPCMQMLNETENNLCKLTEYERDTFMGILWSYFDVKSSLKYFTHLAELEPRNLQYKKINNILISSISNNQKELQNGKEKYFAKGIFNKLI